MPLALYISDQSSKESDSLVNNEYYTLSDFAEASQKNIESTFQSKVKTVFDLLAIEIKISAKLATRPTGQVLLGDAGVLVGERRVSPAGIRNALPVALPSRCDHERFAHKRLPSLVRHLKPHTGFEGRREPT